MKALKILGLVLLLASPLLSQPPGPPISPGSSGGSGTVTNTDATCADTQIIRADGASNTATQCSALTVADTTGNITGPSGGFSIIGGTGASDALKIDGSAGTDGFVDIAANGVIKIGQYTDANNYNQLMIGGDYGYYGTGSLGIWKEGRAAGSSIGQTFGIGTSGDSPIMFATAGSERLTIGSLSTQRIKFHAGNPIHVMGLDTDPSNYERLSLSCDGTADCTIATETAGTGGDDVVLTVKGEGPAGTLVLDGSDDVAGSVTVSADGDITTSVTNQYISIYGNGAGGVSLGASGTGTVRVFTGLQIADSYLYGIGFTEYGGASDTGLSRSAAGVVKITDGSTGMGSLLSLRKVTPDIDGETTTLAQSGTVWTNTGDGDGEAITLLNDPTIGVNYCFAVDVAQTITVAPSTGESLYYGTDQCVVSLTSNSIGSTLCVTAITGGSGAKWFTMSDKGSWTCND